MLSVAIGSGTLGWTFCRGAGMTGGRGVGSGMLGWTLGVGTIGIRTTGKTGCRNFFLGTTTKCDQAVSHLTLHTIFPDKKSKKVQVPSWVEYSNTRSWSSITKCVYSTWPVRTNSQPKGLGAQLVSLKNSLRIFPVELLYRNKVFALQSNPFQNAVI